MLPVYEADGPAVVEVPCELFCEDVATGEVRSDYDHRHDPENQDHCQRAPTAQSTTQWMYDHDIPAFIQHRLTMYANITCRKTVHVCLQGLIHFKDISGVAVQMSN